MYECMENKTCRVKHHLLDVRFEASFYVFRKNVFIKLTLHLSLSTDNLNNNNSFASSLVL
jgi:hypothetical protein